MSLIASLGAIEIGLIFGLVALGVFLSFRIINFPDLTVDGSFPLGGAVAAALIVAGWNPFAATAVGDRRRRAGRLPHRLAQRAAAHHAAARQHPGDDRAVLDQPARHGQAQRRADQRRRRCSAWSTFGGLPDYWLKPLVLLVIVIAAKLLIDLFFASETGLAMRATGGNPRMARAAGHLDRPPDGVGPGAVERAGGAGRRAVRADAGRRRHLDGHRHHRDRPGGGDHRRDHPAGAQPGHHDAGLHPRRGALPLLHRAGAEQRLHRPAGPGPEPGHRRAGRIRAARSRLQAQAGRPVAGARAAQSGTSPSRRPK